MLLLEEGPGYPVALLPVGPDEGGLVLDGALHRAAGQGVVGEGLGDGAAGWQVAPVVPAEGDALLLAHPGLVHDLDLELAPVAELLIVQRRGVAAEDHLAGQALEQRQQLQMILLLVVEAVTSLRAAGMMQVRGVAVDELAALIVVLAQKPVSAAVDHLHGVVAPKPSQRPRIQIDADAAQRGRLALHDRPAAQMGLDVGIVWRHQGDNRLAQPGGRLRSEICAHLG